MVSTGLTLTSLSHTSKSQRWKRSTQTWDQLKVVRESTSLEMVSVTTPIHFTTNADSPHRLFNYRQRKPKLLSSTRLTLHAQPQVDGQKVMS